MMDYGEQPDRKATRVTPDEIDPSYSQVEFNDGTMETMPTSQAEVLPFEAPAVAGDMAAAPYDPAAYGPPAAPAPPPPADPAAPAPPPGFSPVPAIDPSRQPGVVPAGPNVVRGDSFRPEGQLPGSPLAAQDAAVGTGAAQPDMGEIVAPGAPGGMAPYGESATYGTQETERVEDPSAAMERTGDAYDAEARAQHLRDNMAYAAKRDTLDAELDARDAQQAQLQEQLAQAEAERKQQERVVAAIEKTPIDEDGFWSESPGRQAAAWIALALSGFLQGATRGQNPALNQMVQALDHAQDRWLHNQQKARDSQLKTRERLIGDRTTAIASMKMQLSGIMERRIMLDAQREGIQPPPGLATYMAEGAVKRAKAQTEIGQQTVRIATEQRQQESRMTPGTGPVTRFDQGLRAIGVDPKKHQEAMSPTVDLGGKVRSADELKQIHQALAKIAAENGGQLPAQGTLSLSKLGLAPFAARWGVATDQVTTQQLLNQASLAYMSAIGNIKGMDSNVEREKFDSILNSGEGQTTLRAIQERANFAEQQAVSIASGFAGGNARRYVDLLKAQQVTPSKQGDFPERVVQPPTEAQTINQAGGGGATRPLPTAHPAARALETSTTGSRPGTYQRLRGSRPGVRP